jgi:hypothetical protein
MLIYFWTTSTLNNLRGNPLCRDCNMKRIWSKFQLSLPKSLQIAKKTAYRKVLQEPAVILQNNFITSWLVLMSWSVYEAETDVG